jgi:hypothetical protein
MDLDILRDGRTTNVTIILQERPNWKNRYKHKYIH